MPVQKQTRAGQRTQFKAFVAIGDCNGHVGLGAQCSKEVATAIRGAIILAKLSIVPVRGAGIVSAPVPKKLLMMAGIDDCYTSARGCTATLGNFAKATFDAISKTYTRGVQTAACEPHAALWPLECGSSTKYHGLGESILKKWH
ncbi:hypothetical protein QTO34_008010 [Cnephaeus nilssonii]|uniref:Small ribosomal subunit protein uS5 n=1 Tax=Cnephaeus nilssonii TaxID=3371016 RepID=A0AA40I9W7_CNENI|nr:hypothetical protein QTO34_008010 [Eptesicus nilssonii]